LNGKTKLRLAVIFGGRSGEHEVSLSSARSVLAALNKEKYQVIEIGITMDGGWVTGEDVLTRLSTGKTTRLQPCTLLPDPSRPGLYALHQHDNGESLTLIQELDCVFPVLHGTYGEDGTLQGLFELANLAYVGAGVTGSANGMDKDIFKRIMQAHHIPVVDWMLVLRSELKDNLPEVIDRATRLAPFPLFVKPANLGSSVGVTKCRSKSDLIEGLFEAARYDRRILVEKGIDAREIEVSVLGNDQPQASIPGEIRPAADFYSYTAKYQNADSELLIPAPISPEYTDLVQTLAVKAYRAIDCAGMARVDFLLDRQNEQIYLNEINTIPGFTQISMYPKLWEASGIPYPELLDRLIELALARKADRAATTYRLEKEN
jgi:D-alanine-D-alanine ligase